MKKKPNSSKMLGFPLWEKKENVAIIIPTLDTELSLYSKNKELIQNECGAKVMVSDENVISIIRNKVKTYEFLKENNLIYLATSGLDGNAKVRPILFYFEEDEKPYFCTANTKPMFKELDANPNCEIVVRERNEFFLFFSHKCASKPWI